MYSCYMYILYCTHVFDLNKNSQNPDYNCAKADKVRTQKKITVLFGNFSQVADPPPHPPLLGTPYSKKNFIVYFAF